MAAGGRPTIAAADNGEGIGGLRLSAHRDASALEQVSRILSRPLAADLSINRIPRITWRSMPPGMPRIECRPRRRPRDGSGGTWRTRSTVVADRYPSACDANWSAPWPKKARIATVPANDRERRPLAASAPDGLARRRVRGQHARGSESIAASVRASPSGEPSPDS